VTTATPILPYARPKSESRLSLTDKYLIWVCLILLGYALDGRGFAYFFLGEMALAVGAQFLVNTRGWTTVFQLPQLLLLLPFWAWGAARTIPFLTTYRLDAVRDAMLWGYSGFAFIIAGLILAKPTRLVQFLQRYSRFAFIFLALIPLVAVTYRALGTSMPRWPIVNIAIIQEKEGDVMVHLAGIFAFWIAGLGGRVKPLWIALLTANAAVMGVVDRAGQLAFMAAFGVCAICRPRHPIIWRITTGRRFSDSASLGDQARHPHCRREGPEYLLRPGSSPTSPASPPTAAPMAWTAPKNGVSGGGTTSSATRSMADIAGRARALA